MFKVDKDSIIDPLFEILSKAITQYNIKSLKSVIIKDIALFEKDLGKVEFDDWTGTLINWSDIRSSPYDSTPLYEEMTPKDFFARYFSSADYEVHIPKITSAIDAANKLIGIETIPRLSHRYLSALRVELKHNLSNKSYEQMRFWVCPDQMAQFHPNWCS